mgnify:CR=1 FL=1
MLKLLRNRMVASTLGFAILMSLAWFMGPYLGLPSEQSRLYVVVGILMIWVVFLMIGRLLSERAGRLLDKMLRRQADEAVIGASADQRREVAMIPSSRITITSSIRVKPLAGRISSCPDRRRSRARSHPAV